MRYGARGLEQVSYRGHVVADVGRWPEDKFHIWHMKALDGSGHVLSTGQYGWGENNDGRRWDASSKAWTYTFSWGTIRTQYLQRGDVLDVKVITTNRHDSNVTLDGASVYPLSLHLEEGRHAGPRIVDGAVQPGVVALHSAEGEIVAVAPDAGRPVWSGFEGGEDGALALVVSGTRPDSVNGASNREGRRVLPGTSETVTLSLRFAQSGTALAQVATDAYRSWSERWPPRPAWKDRRAIGTVFLASSPQGDKTIPGGFQKNPRRYFNDAGTDTSDAIGLQQFQSRVIARAEMIVTNLRRIDAQGAITWDIEGEEFPQDTSYVCAPDQIGVVAPEMESTIGSGSRYAGTKLVDAYFKVIRDAGFRVGVCVRPQRFALGADGHARQQFLPEREIAGELIRKMRYAHDRWGATLFYLDSTVGADGGTLDASVIEAAAAAMPDSLLIPEESSFRMYRASAPFMTFLFHGDLGTDVTVQAAYPNAFGVNLINDVDSGKLATHRAELVDAVRRGDVLMVHADYWHVNNSTVLGIYREAKRGVR